MKKIGILGVGVISQIYLQNITNMFKEIEVLGVYDLIPEKAEKATEQFNLPKTYNSMDEILADPDIDIILNLTRPYEHYEVIKAALEAGKHVYTEKPLGATFEEGKKLKALAEDKNLVIAGAPDTFMGAGIQSCRKIIDEGLIGQPIGAAGFFTCRGHESWHADPEFYYKFGGGPMMDMGPYYLTAMVNLLGRVEKVAGMTKASFDKRLITSEPLSGTIIDVDVDTHITGMLQFSSGAIGTIMTTFDVHAAEMPRIEIYGSEGTLSVPDPNYFDGPVRMSRLGDPTFKEIPLFFTNYRDNSRGLGLADMAKAIENGRRPRCHVDQLLHVLEVMTRFSVSSEKEQFITLETAYERGAPMVFDQIKGILD